MGGLLLTKERNKPHTSLMQTAASLSNKKNHKTFKTSEATTTTETKSSTSQTSRATTTTTHITATTVQNQVLETHTAPSTEPSGTTSASTEDNYYFENSPVKARGFEVIDYFDEHLPLPFKGVHYEVESEGYSMPSGRIEYTIDRTVPNTLSENYEGSWLE